ncbi:hypothetical protein AAZX31_20G232900 [Glycine max]|uniref:Transcription factor bHLH128 n=1 Tax=Glycine soja TaxID=3848 RepID=A0A0B2R046_GLYSO|nr:transcription factor bHLH128-like [Glycine soja]KAG4908731.1 hypothetical protein JHK86_057215 [Glycine max]KAG4919959.1 hypothetical protein JHK85_058240 [Glycine max]KAG5076042.1 hypothetical protein JHK84_057273 [Glycine max]KAG5078687.1 hypothetical protein JHK82_057382 [Glycine max]KAH1037848.1 hypothetical protein GYH30_056929 [Glycine max]
MYPSSSSSSSSSSSQSMTQAGLTRYGSAPGSLLTSTVDSLIGGSRPSPYFSGESSESPCKEQRSFHNHPPSFASSLLRQKSSPAGFLSHLSNHHGVGFTITPGGLSNSNSNSNCSLLKSQLSFTHESLSNTVNVDPSSTTFGMDPWDNNSIAFSATSTKRSKTNTNDPDILHSLNSALESQFNLPHTSLEMSTVDKLLHIPEDSVPCKIRAKRGCATHPRSIAERERRTRISGKLKKLQDLVPNMDKQTSYADMLDLAVQHIKGLQTQVQKLHKEMENCTCGCKQSK